MNIHVHIHPRHSHSTRPHPQYTLPPDIITVNKMLNSRTSNCRLFFTWRDSFNAVDVMLSTFGAFACLINDPVTSAMYLKIEDRLKKEQMENRKNSKTKYTGCTR